MSRLPKGWHGEARAVPLSVLEGSQKPPRRAGKWKRAKTSKEDRNSSKSTGKSLMVLCWEFRAGGVRADSGAARSRRGDGANARDVRNAGCRA